MTSHDKFMLADITFYMYTSRYQSHFLLADITSHDNTWCHMTSNGVMTSHGHHMAITWPNMTVTWPHMAITWPHMTVTWPHMAITWPHMTHLSLQVLQGMKQYEIRRQENIQELVYTERSHLHRLKIMKHVRHPQYCIWYNCCSAS